jgi:Ala-tRNA(Pro) deacylase
MKVDKTDAYTEFINFLNERGMRYRLIEHLPEGRTEIVSQLRGNPVPQAAKCIVLMVKVGKKITRYILAVVPGDTRVDFNAVKTLLNGTYISFASAETAEKLTRCLSGTILPVSFNPQLELIVDSSVRETDEIYFNAARLDRSVALNTGDYLAAVKPRLEPIAVR